MRTARTRTPDIRQSNNTENGGHTVGHHVAAYRWHVGVLATAIVMGLVASAAVAQDQGNRCANVNCLADMIVRQIPKGEKMIALIPFRAPSTGLPDKDAETLYGSIYSAMGSASKNLNREQNFVRHDDIYDEMWKSSYAESEESDFQGFASRLRATVMVYCKDNGLQEEGMLRFECTSTDVGNRSKLEGTPTSQAVIPIRRDQFQYEYVLSRLGNNLADKMKILKKLEKKFTHGETKLRSGLTEDIKKRIESVILNKFARLRKGKEREDDFNKATDKEIEVSAASTGGYALDGELRWIDKRRKATLSLTLWDDGIKIMEDSETIERAWIPAHLIDPAALRYQAQARAVPSSDLSPEFALPAAANLARALVVTDALDIQAPHVGSISSEADSMEGQRTQGMPVGEIRSGADSMEALRTLEQGIPVSEKLGFQTSAEGMVTVRLDASVVAIANVAKPEVQARLERDKLRGGEQMRIMLSTSETVSVAIFAWATDNEVVRLYPNSKKKHLEVMAGGSITLPGTEDGVDNIIVNLPPNRAESHSAIIVLASLLPLDLNAIKKAIPMAKNKKSNSWVNADRASSFLNALATLDLSQAALFVLPFSVRR